MSTKTVHNIQALRGIAALAILVLHLIKFGRAKYGLETDVFDFLVSPLAIGVDIFFVISGFVMVLTANHLYGRKDALNFAMKRITRVYPLWWFLCALLIPVFLMRPEWINSSDDTPTSLLHSLLLIPHAGTPLIMVGWTLEYEIFFYLVFGLGILLVKPSYRMTFLTAWVLISIGFGLYFLPQSASGQLVTNVFLLEFLAGCYLGWLYPRYLNQNWITALSIFILGSAWLIISQFLDWSRVMSFLVPSVAYIATALIFEVRYNFIMGRVMDYLGDISYALYLIHVLVISAMGRFWLALSLDETIPSTLLLFMMATASIIGAMFLHHFIELPSTPWLRRRLR